VVLALEITKKPISRGVIIGAIMLAGIVVNNSIVLVDRINFLRGRKKRGPLFHLPRMERLKTREKRKRGTILKSVLEAGEDRFRPIVMTTSTTILGLLPMAFDRSESANLWSPLAITVIGGLISSTVLTLFLIPSLYLIFDDLRRSFNPMQLILFVQNRIYGIIKVKSRNHPA